MTKIILVLILTLGLCSSVFAGEAHALQNYWYQLLHYDGERSRVVSEEFFLALNGEKDPASELQETLRLLKGVNGLDIACNFPARYQWLKAQYNEVPSFDLNNCAELQAYLQNFQQDTLSLVFVSEFLDAPASAFGHIMLVFQNHGMPLALADTIHFSAVTRQSDSFLRYAYRGITGKYDGVFMRQPLFEKQNEYSVREQRALYFYRLNLSVKEISQVIFHLYELRKARFHYFFVSENCAFQIGELLDIAFFDKQQITHGAILPIDIVRKYSDFIIERSVLPPSLFYADKLLSNMSPEQRGAIERVIEQRVAPSNELPNLAKEILALHYQYAFRRKGVIYDNYAQVRSLQYTPSVLQTSLKDPLSADLPSRVLLAAYKDRQQAGLLLGYRPMLRDFYAMQHDALQESEMSLLDLQVLALNKSIRLHQLDLLKIMSLPKHSVLNQDLSWSVYAGLNRDNVAQSIRPEIEAGFGESIGGQGFTLSGMLSAGIQGNAGIDFYAKPSVIGVGYLSESDKIGFQVSDKRLQGGHYLQDKVFVSHSLEKGCAVLSYTQTQIGGRQLVFSYSLPI
jgi:hypothetical protein